MNKAYIEFYLFSLQTSTKEKFATFYRILKSFCVIRSRLQFGEIIESFVSRPGALAQTLQTKNQFFYPHKLSTK